MKTLIKLLIVAAVVFSGINKTFAQATKETKKIAKHAEITKMIIDARYIFEANYANPMRGGQKQLTSPYDLKVTKDTITAFLPYFGRSYIAPDPATTEGGIKFTSTNFSYSSKQTKNGNWNILIKPKDKNITDWRDVQQLTLSISTNGYATLDVISTHRDPISFYGTVEPIAKR